MSTVTEEAPAAELTAPTPSARRTRALGYLVLALLAYVPPLLSAPGKVAADTKQYLYLDPGRLLGRAVTMWDPNVGMGTVTHQTIGYVFPMGPYYWVLDTLGVPDWVAQRLWLGSLLFGAGVGMLFLLRTFGVKGPGVVVAALAYMFTPYVLDYAARISVLLLPWAALPWMIAIVRKALKDGGWRYPAIFALIVQVIGGVNATALMYAGIAPVLWIAYAWLIAREVDWRRALGVVVRTGALTILASLWWISGLRMQAAYGLDILRYTETIDAVARTSTPNEVLRGLGYWFFYGQDRLGPWIEASSDYTQHLWVIVSGYVLAALGVLAASFIRWTHRTYFVALLVVGVIVAVGAHPYASPTPFGALFKALSSGSTAALAMRSTGRAVPLVVCALAVMLGLAVNRISGRLRDRGRTTWALVVPGVVVVLVFVNFPALYNGTYYGKNLQRPEDIPSYWTDAIAALSARGNDTRILELPGADFASYRWGNTVDPITPGLTDRPYLARELIPYGTAGTADLLNAMDRRLQEGVADERGLAAVWRRMGIGDVVARNDIQYERYDLVPPRELARVLGRTPGLGPPAPYGPPADFSARGYLDELALTAPFGEPGVAPVVVYPVENPTPIVRAESTEHSIMLSGDGEGMVDAADVGLLDGTGALRYSGWYTTPDELRDAVGAGDILVVTDSNRLRARKWSSVKDNLGYTEMAGGADAPLKHDNGDARLPLFPGQQASAYTTTQQVGVERVVASAFGNTITYTPEDTAARALDGDPYTSWRANAFGDAVGQQIRIDFAEPITTDHIVLVQPTTGGNNRWLTEVDLEFDGGSTVPVTLGPESRVVEGQTVTFPRRTFERLDITVRQTSMPRTNLFGRDDSVGFAEIKVRDENAADDVRVQEIVQMPTDLVDALGAGAEEHPLMLVMRRYAVRPVPPRGQPELAINRAFVLPVARTFTVQGSAAISTQAPIDALQSAYGIPTADDGGVTLAASRVLEGCNTCGPDAAIDGDPRTAWRTPIVDVLGSYVAYTNAEPITFDRMKMQIIADGRHSVPTRLRLNVDGETRIIEVPPIADQAVEGATTTVEITFPRVTGRQIRVTVEAVRELRTKRFASDEKPLLPIAVAEFGIAGLEKPDAPAVVDSGCRADLVAIDGTPFPVRVTGRPAGPDAVLTLNVTACDPDDPSAVPALTLEPGRHVLTTARGKDVGWSIDRLVLASGTDDTPVSLDGGRVTRIGDGSTPEVPQVDVVRSGRTSLRVRVTGATEPFWMVLGQSRSSGWQAKIVGGDGLGEPHLVDGYANGWLVTPASADFEVAMEWVPQRQVWAALWLSLASALLCVGIVIATWRRRVSSAAVANATDAAIDLRLADPRDPVRPGRWVRIGAPLLAGVIAAVFVAPWVGMLIAAATALIASFRELRRYVLFVPALLVFLAGAYIALQQYRYEFPSVFEWPTLFPRARTAAWIAVMLLAGDVIVETFRARKK